MDGQTVPDGSLFKGFRKHTGAELIRLKVPVREYLISGLLRPGECMMVYAETGLGKSWFVWALAVTITGGGDFTEHYAEEF